MAEREGKYACMHKKTDVELNDVNGVPRFFACIRCATKLQLLIVRGDDTALNKFVDDNFLKIEDRGTEN
jgi:hypothetical protein